MNIIFKGYTEKSYFLDSNFGFISKRFRLFQMAAYLFKIIDFYDRKVENLSANKLSRQEFI